MLSLVIEVYLFHTIFAKAIPSSRHPFNSATIRFQLFSPESTDTSMLQ